MSEAFLGEIRLFSFAFAPRGWALCQGQLLPVQQNAALFSLLGTFYGGDGIRSFGLPDLRGRSPLGVAAGADPGAQAGSETVTLNTANLPQHNHQLQATTNPATTNAPGGNLLASAQCYGPGSGLTATNGGTLGNQGGSQPVSNLQPALVLNYSIALQGIFPTRS